MSRTGSMNFRRRRSFWLGLAFVVLATITGLGLATGGFWPQAASDLPVASFRKGDFLVMVKCRGELVARRSVQVTAPSRRA
jgi:HlyD family secretion protein